MCKPYHHLSFGEGESSFRKTEITDIFETSREKILALPRAGSRCPVAEFASPAARGRSGCVPCAGGSDLGSYPECRCRPAHCLHQHTPAARKRSVSSSIPPFFLTRPARGDGCRHGSIPANGAGGSRAPPLPGARCPCREGTCSQSS